MKVKIISLICAILVTPLVVLSSGMVTTGALQEPVAPPLRPVETTQPVIETTVHVVTQEEVEAHFIKYAYAEFNTIEENERAIAELETYVNWLTTTLIEMYSNEINYSEISTWISEECDKVSKTIVLYENKIFSIKEEILWQKRAEEYPVATQIWLFMKEELGWSDEVCAGVLGNMMAEAGGQTLKIKWNIWDKSGGCYGICQWAIKYTPTIADNSLENQLLHIKNTVEKTMNNWGYKYAKGFGYAEFIALEDPKEVALAFAACYERCHTRHYQIRTVNAMKAYEYFTSDTRE